jgi:hypothetical protein
VPVAILLAAVLLVPGETLDYDVKWGGLRLGSLTLQTLEPDTVRGESCHAFRADLSIRLGFLFHAEYEFEALSRVSDLATLRSSKRTEESRYRDYWTAEFDQDSLRAYYSDGDTFELEGETFDLLTLWYLFRTLDVTEQDTLVRYCHTDRRNWAVAVTNAGEEEVKLRTGGFYVCDRLVPVVSGPLGEVYLAQREDRVPVVIRMKTGGIEVSAVLKEVRTMEER